MTMITTDRVDAIADRISDILNQFPTIVDQMRATAESREQLLDEVSTLQRTLDTMNVALSNLREDKTMLEGRIGALLTENARLEALLNNIGSAIKSNQQVQDGVALLAASRNGKIVEHASEAAE